MKGLTPFVATIAIVASAACGSDKPAPKTGDDEAAATARAKPEAGAAAKKDDVATPTSGSILIDDKIMKACGDLPTAHFAFDSAKVESGAAAALDALAKCFASGPLKGKGMLLVGHADPRGEFEHNLKL